MRARSALWLVDLFEPENQSAEFVNRKANL